MRAGMRSSRSEPFHCTSWQHKTWCSAAARLHLQSQIIRLGTDDLSIVSAAVGGSEVYPRRMAGAARSEDGAVQDAAAARRHHRGTGGAPRGVLVLLLLCHARDSSLCLAASCTEDIACWPSRFHHSSHLEILCLRESTVARQQTLATDCCAMPAGRSAVGAAPDSQGLPVLHPAAAHRHLQAACRAEGAAGQL